MRLNKRRVGLAMSEVRTALPLRGALGQHYFPSRLILSNHPLQFSAAWVTND